MASPIWIGVFCAAAVVGGGPLFFSNLAQAKPKGDTDLSFVDSKQGGYDTCALDKKGHYDGAYMTGHGQESDYQIKVCHVGNGHFSENALKAVKNENWFVSISSLDEVRFVCPEKKMPEKERVLFPTQKEIEDGRGIRIEIPCTYDERKTRAAMARAKQLIFNSKDHAKTANESMSLIKYCGSANLQQQECMKRREVFDAIFQGRAAAPLENDGIYRGENFNVGLGEKNEATQQNSRNIDLTDDGRLNSVNKVALKEFLKNREEREIKEHQTNEVKDLLKECKNKIKKLKSELVAPLDPSDKSCSACMEEIRYCMKSGEKDLFFSKEKIKDENNCWYVYMNPACYDLLESEDKDAVVDKCTRVRQAQELKHFEIQCKSLKTATEFQTQLLEDNETLNSENGQAVEGVPEDTP